MTSDTGEPSSDDRVAAALQADGQLLSAEEKSVIESAAQSLEKLMKSTDHRAIRQAADALNRATEQFAERRMDEGIRRALAGRKIGSL